ncbi:acyl-CoA dehydrogenase [Methyloprofundus sp.]|uniref:acyl-CoA dehydrogenase n=1 Tax=Methyloprofundus sp. TaxID=2020875 RepID=UPI003D0A4F47
MSEFILFFIIVMISVGFAPIRRNLLTRPLFNKMRKSLPSMSQTEREALEAGDTWWDAELFTGKPDWQKLQDLPAASLSQTEQDFIEGPVEELCAMLDDWDITYKRRDLPPEVWDFIKQNKFCGIIIPKQYGGLEFGDYAHSQIVMKISSRSASAAVTVMVPNSLGPAKLLLAYGSEQQKNHYLPRLAVGTEIPAFALTGPQAGSDAGAMPDTGILCHAEFAGKEQLGIRLNWEKRYITLGPVATVLGLAFKLYDPEHLLGDQEELGITVALIPTGTAGVSIGKRHFPLDSAFQNGPNWGKDVFIPIDWIIGGADQVGQGWKMLMECLSTGRAISLPALSVGAAKFVCRNSGAYARVRTQFNLPIGAFEGIEEVLARMAGTTYLMDAAREVTCAALDEGHKPSVISAIIKYQLTEGMRRVINDGMDIQGGSGICLGPSNYIGRLYQTIPVGITVEGANILTRTMMIFGQGAVRCHPFIQSEMAALNEVDKHKALKDFDAVLIKHIGFFMTNFGRGFWFGLSNARFSATPGDENTRRYYQQLARMSTSFALTADFALLTLGGSLKRKERISGRFADVLSHLYLCSCALKHFADQGSQTDDLALLNWACQYSLYHAQQSLLAVFSLLPMRTSALLIRTVLFPLGKPFAPPQDALVGQLAQQLLNDSPVRDRLTAGIYINDNPKDATGRIEIAFKAVLLAAPVEAKLHAAVKQGQLEKGYSESIFKSALDKNIITQAEVDILTAADEARSEAIRVDYFDAEELTGGVSKN